MKHIIISVLLVSCGADQVTAPAVATAPEQITAPAVAATPTLPGYPPALYIATVGDLPACGPDNAHQLIYIAETADFHTCLGNDWTVVDVTEKIMLPGEKIMLPGEKTIEQRETTIIEIVEKIVTVEKIVSAEDITPEMPKYHFTHTETNDLDNKLGTLNYFIYSARIVDIGNGTLLLTFKGYGDGDGNFSHGRIMTIGANAEFYFPIANPINGNAPPVLKATVNSLTSLTIERTQTAMTDTSHTFDLIAE